jgi:hypothetical protein
MRRLILPLLAAAAALSSPVATFGADPAAPVSGAPDEPVLARLIAALVAETPQRAPTGDVTVVRSFTDPWGIPCRDFVQNVLIGEDLVSASGTMCRAANGSWILQRE